MGLGFRQAFWLPLCYLFGILLHAPVSNLLKALAGTTDRTRGLGVSGGTPPDPDMLLWWHDVAHGEHRMFSKQFKPMGPQSGMARQHHKLPWPTRIRNTQKKGFSIWALKKLQPHRFVKGDCRGGARAQVALFRSVKTRKTSRNRGLRKQARHGPKKLPRPRKAGKQTRFLDVLCDCVM